MPTSLGEFYKKLHDDQEHEETENVKQNEVTPEAWRKVRLKSDTAKKGDVEDVGNHRPISFFASVAQTVHDNAVQQIISKT